MAEMLTLQSFDEEPSKNKLVIFNFAKDEYGITNALTAVTARESNKGKLVFHLVFDIKDNIKHTKFTDANSEVENIRVIKVNLSTAVRDTHEIYAGEMIRYLEELIFEEDYRWPNVVVIDSSDEIVGTNVVNKLLKLADDTNIDIYTATRLRSKNYREGNV
jgi:hypothetical protein